MQEARSLRKSLICAVIGAFRTWLKRGQLHTTSALRNQGIRIKGPAEVILMNCCTLVASIASCGQPGDINTDIPDYAKLWTLGVILRKSNVNR